MEGSAPDQPRRIAPRSLRSTMTTREGEKPPMAKKSRKKKARKNSKANHGKRPNS
jgi:hypothetical protein